MITLTHKQLKQSMKRGFTLTDVSLSQVVIGAALTIALGAGITVIAEMNQGQVQSDINEVYIASHKFWNNHTTTAGTVPDAALPPRLVISAGTYEHALNGALTITGNSNSTFDISAAGFDDDQCQEIAASYNKNIGTGKTVSMALNATTLTAPGTAASIATACSEGDTGNTITLRFNK